jgi:hypothetical protein
MMGPRQVDQAALFYEFSLERHVPATHLLRSIDRFVDLSDVRSHLAPFYSSTGRPSIDPELLGAVTSAVLVHLRVEPAHFDWRWRERPALALLAWEA